MARLSGVLRGPEGSPYVGVRVSFVIVDAAGRPALVPGGQPGLVIGGAPAVVTDVAGAFTIELVPSVGATWGYILQLEGAGLRSTVRLREVPDVDAVALDDVLPPGRWAY